MFSDDASNPSGPEYIKTVIKEIKSVEMYF